MDLDEVDSLQTRRLPEAGSEDHTLDKLLLTDRDDDKTSKKGKARLQDSDQGLGPRGRIKKRNGGEMLLSYLLSARI